MSIFLRSGRTSLCTKDSQDSFDDVKAPSPQESRAERETRLRYTAECQRRSDAIDEEINRRREMDKRSSKCVRLLLLGKSYVLNAPLLLIVSLGRPKRIR